MPGPIQRSTVVKHFGTPDRTEGSLNEPRDRSENGLVFNEKWIYLHPSRDPAHAAQRIVMWRRYDYVGSLIRRTPTGEWELDPSLPGSLG